MGDVDLHSLLARLENDSEFIADCCRFSESILTEAQVRKKWRLPDDVYEELGRNDLLIERIEAEKLRRMRDGSTKREKSQLHIMRAPEVLSRLMDDPSVSPRHRVDAIKTLDSFTGNTPEAVAASDRFIITINLGADENGKPVVEHYSKPYKINDPLVDVGSAPLTPGNHWSDDEGGNAAQDMIEDAVVKRSSAEIAALDALMLVDE
jgi:hypothetical protein